MNIDFFREKFIDVMKRFPAILSSATIELMHCEYWDKSRWATVTKVTKNGDKIILSLIEEYSPKDFYKFTDMSIFDGVKEVIFELNGKEIDEFDLVDISLSDRIFVFEADFNKYKI